MTAGLHKTLLAVALRSLRLLPGPVLSALDAWSHRVARRRALERQRKWQQVRGRVAAAVPPRSSTT